MRTDLNREQQMKNERIIYQLVIMARAQQLQLSGRECLKMLYKTHMLKIYCKLIKPKKTK